MKIWRFEITVSYKPSNDYYAKRRLVKNYLKNFKNLSKTGQTSQVEYWKIWAIKELRGSFRDLNLMEAKRFVEEINHKYHIFPDEWYEKNVAGKA